MKEDRVQLEYDLTSKYAPEREEIGNMFMAEQATNFGWNDSNLYSIIEAEVFNIHVSEMFKKTKTGCPEGNIYRQDNNVIFEDAVWKKWKKKLKAFIQS